MKTNLSGSKVFSFLAIFVGLIISFPANVLSQQKIDNNALKHEVYEGEYIPDLRESLPKSPRYVYSTPGFFTIQVNVDEDGQNIVGDAANEPSIAIDPNNPNNMVIGWRQFNTVNNNFRQAGYAFTTDGGDSWTFPGVIEPGIFRSDPVLDYDNEGNIFYNSLTVSGEDYLCDVFKSTDGGMSWDEGVFAQGGDKQWMTVDRSGGPGDGNLYAFWTAAYSICPPNNFTRSADNGASFQNCVLIPGNPFWGTNTVNAEGALYIGAFLDEDFVVIKSTNAQFPGSTIVWDYIQPVDLGGFISSFGGDESPNPSGLLGQTSIAVDKSGGPTQGNIYLLCSVFRWSPYDPLDVMFAKSTDDGSTWSDPVRINDDPSNSAWQWFGTMSVAPNGRIDVIWLDTRDFPGQVYSELYYSYSTDAGESWLENEPLSESFDPHVGWPNQEKMGDYFHMISDETGANLAWANTLNGEQDVYYGRIETEIVGTRNPKTHKTARLYQNIPNPVKDETTIRFQLEEKSNVLLEVYDINGKLVSTIFSGIKGPGGHTFSFNVSSLESGIYYYRLTTGNQVLSKKLMVLGN
jgi:hypothetical protein